MTFLNLFRNHNRSVNIGSTGQAIMPLHPEKLLILLLCNAYLTVVPLCLFAIWFLMEAVSGSWVKTWSATEQFTKLIICPWQYVETITNLWHSIYFWKIGFFIPHVHCSTKFLDCHCFFVAHLSNAIASMLGRRKIYRWSSSPTFVWICGVLGH